MDDPDFFDLPAFLHELPQGNLDVFSQLFTVILLGVLIQLNVEAQIAYLMMCVEKRLGKRSLLFLHDRKDVFLLFLVKELVDVAQEHDVDLRRGNPLQIEEDLVEAAVHEGLLTPIKLLRKVIVNLECDAKEMDLLLVTRLAQILFQNEDFSEHVVNFVLVVFVLLVNFCVFKQLDQSEQTYFPHVYILVMDSSFE